MNYYKSIVILLLAFLPISCERDDICAATTSTTPRLLIEFYDATSTDDLLNVPRITVYGEGLITDDDGNPIQPTESSDKIVIAPDDTNYLFNTNYNTIELPLIVGVEDEEAITRFVLERDTNLRLDTDDTTESNEDILEIRYIPKFEYVSRACGHKSIFEIVDISVDTMDDSDIWIGNIEIVETLIENENTVHVKIYH